MTFLCYRCGVPQRIPPQDPQTQPGAKSAISAVLATQPPKSSQIWSGLTTLLRQPTQSRQAACHLQPMAMCCLVLSSLLSGTALKPPHGLTLQLWKLLEQLTAALRLQILMPEKLSQKLLAAALALTSALGLQTAPEQLLQKLLKQLAAEQ